MADTGTGANPLRVRVNPRLDAVTPGYVGNVANSILVAEVQTRVISGADLFIHTDADGFALGASGGSAWFLMPLAFGGGFKTVEARFRASFTAEALSGLNWQVRDCVEVRNA